MVDNSLKLNSRTVTTMHGGLQIDLLHPDVSDITIFDIAHHLSLICRWGGTSEYFFSVAEHCVMAAEMAPQEHRLPILLHDCEEAILGDNITPLKMAVPGLIELGNKIRSLILDRFGIDRVLGYDQNIVDYYDREQLLWEEKNIINGQYVGMVPMHAKGLYIRKFYEYREYCELPRRRAAGY